jgi:molybdenum cofactor cytidylyltransferase
MNGAECTAIILAAGRSSRMGSPKALLEFRGESFAGRLRRVLQPYCRSVIVVGSPASEFPVDVVNPEPDRGMLSSLQCGLRAVPASADAVLFTPVDLPAVSERTVSTLISGWSGELLRIPRYGGKRGHPVMFARSLTVEFLAAAGSPKEVIDRHADAIVYTDVDDPGILTDVDTPEDYRKLTEAR